MSIQVNYTNRNANSPTSTTQVGGVGSNRENDQSERGKWKKNITSLLQLGIAYTSATFSALGAAIGQRQNLTYIEWEKDVIHDRIEEAAGSKGSKLSNAPGWYLHFWLLCTTFAFSEICPICCCCLSQHGQHTADAAGEVPLAKQQLENHISIISWIGRYPIIWCHTNIILNMFILLLIFIWNPFPNRLSCLREWPCQTQKLERLPAGRKLSIFLQNYSMLPSSSFSACQCLFPDPVRAQYRV